MEDDEINYKEEIFNLKEELNKLRKENNEINQKLIEQSLELKNLKAQYNTDKERMESEISSLKEKLNSKDNVPPLCNSYITPFSSKDKTIDSIQEPEKGDYITSLSFYRSNSVDLSVAQLIYYGYDPIDGDIRKDAGGLFCILGCKYEKNQPYITNIIGSVSEKEEPVIIYENGIQYSAVKDPLNNADIHKGSGGNFLCFYYTKDPKAGKPIKKIRTLSTREFLKDPNIVRYCTRKTKYNKPFEPLDCNRGRDSIIRLTPQNYIFLERE